MDSIRQLRTAADRAFRAGELETAIHLLRRILDCVPDHPHSLHQLALIAHQKGKIPEAEHLLRLATQSEPDNARYHNDLAVVLEQQQKFEAALDCYQAALRLSPTQARIYFNLANVYRALGQAEASATHFQKALELEPDNADALHNLGALYKELGRRTEAEGHFRQVIALAPHRVDAYVNLGSILQANGQDEDALATYRIAVDLDPSAGPPRAGVAGLLFRRGAVEEATALFLPLIAQAAQSADVATTFASLARHLGREAECVRVLTQALQLPELLRSQRQALLFALGKVQDSLGAYPEAFAAYRSANALHQKGFHLQKFLAYSERTLATFSPEYFRSRTQSGVSSQRPVFIVGMPRSGTSLVEQILASHPLVFGAGELAEIERLSIGLPHAFQASDPYPECMRMPKPAALTEAALSYLACLEALAPSSATRVVDKMPGNFLHLGLISALFPKARIIHIQRDPLDTCLSCYFQNFNNGHEYSYELETLGLVYRQYQRVMKHWRSVKGLNVLEVRYEELVHAPEAESRRLVEFCGLPWDPLCLQSHKTKRLVRTASYEQVRRPIYTASAGRSHHYTEFLGTLRAELQKEIAV